MPSVSGDTLALPPSNACHALTCTAGSTAFCASDPAIGLLPILTDGLTHAVVIVEEDGTLEGIVSQTDLLATLAKSLLANSLTGDLMTAGQGI